MGEKINKTDMLGFCAKCEKRDTCKRLCEKAEKYVNQDWYDFGTLDYVNIRDAENMNISEYEIGPWDFNRDDYTSDGLKYIILKMLDDGLTQAEIAYHVPCTLPYINKISKKYKLTDFAS